VVAAPGGVAGEEEREAGGRAVDVGNEGAEARGGAEAVAEEIGFGGDDGLGFALVEGELADEVKDSGDVGGCGGTDVHKGREYRKADGGLGLAFSFQLPVSSFPVASQGLVGWSGISKLSM